MAATAGAASPARDDLRRAAFGEKHWARFERYARGARIGWNWRAVFCSFAEFERWRMPLVAFANVVFLVAGGAASLVFAFGYASWLCYAAYALASYLVLPAFFDVLVFRAVERRIDGVLKSGGTAEEVAARVAAACNPRPTGWTVDVLTWIAGAGMGVLLPYAVQSSIDYMTIFQIRDTVRIAESRLRSFHEQHKRLPLRGEMGGARATDIVHVRQEWDDERRALHVWLRTTAGERIEAGFVLRPQVDASGKLGRVQCFNVSIPPRWLPAGCAEPWR